MEQALSSKHRPKHPNHPNHPNHRQPRRLEPRFEDKPRSYSMTGTLGRIHEKGYGFLMTGKGSPDYFLRRQQVPAKAWIKGARFGFDHEDPLPGKSAPRATNVVVLFVPPLPPQEGDARD